MTADLAFNYEDLRFIELEEPGSKFPAKKWGGYSQDYEEASRVYTHGDVQMHPRKAWGVVGIDAVPHASVSLLVFDLDVHKAPDDFDLDALSLPANTAIVRSQSGGFHVYFMVHEPRGAGAESDFQMTESLGWDIDIRGSYVSHHVVAPGDVPGIGGDYELVNDDTIAGVFDPADAAERIRYQGEPLLAVDRDTGVTNFEFDRPSEAPAEMPTCYHAGLELRKAAPDDHPNTHKVNVLTALCGLAAGYEPEDVAGHFCGEWAPQDGDVDHSDVDETEYQVGHLAEKLEAGEYSPPALSTLREWGILDAGEACDCVLPYHGESGQGADHTAVLPPAVRNLTDTTEWDWRSAAEDHDPGLTVNDARERTVEAIADAYQYGDRALIEALPTTGKSYGAVEAVAETGAPVTITTGRGRKEQYDQFTEWCDEHGLTYKELPSFTHDCPTAAGEHGEEWRDIVMDWYRRGATPQQIHNAAEYHLDRPLPCQVAETGERIDCSYRHAWDFDADEYDVLIGHYTHAYTQQATEGRVVVFDEFPDTYETDLYLTKRAVSYWLQATDGVPFEDYTDLVENRDDQQRRADALLWFEDHGVEPDETHVFDDAHAHADAPLAVFTLLAGEGLGNGFEIADLDDVGTGVYNRETTTVSVLRPPDLEYASGVVALDGTPTKQMWELALGERLNHREVLPSDEERAEYIRDALGLDLVRTTEYVKPYNSGDHVNTDRDGALLEAIADQHDAAPSLITTMTAKGEYDDAGLLDLVDETKHYGNVLGSNEFDDARLGAVIGSNHYGDGYIKKWGAYAGEAVERNDEKGAGLSYGGFGDDVLEHMREHDTLQAAMRFGRDGNGAVVYVHTDTLPDWVPIAGEGRVVSTWSDGMRDVVDALADLGEATTAELVTHPAVDLSRQQVFDHLETLRERGVLQRQQDTEDGRRVVWRDDGLHRLGDHGDVDLEPVDLEDLDEEEVRQLARSSIYTWEFTNLTAEDAGSLGEVAGDAPPPSRAAATGGTPPPDDAD